MKMMLELTLISLVALMNWESGGIWVSALVFCYNGQLHQIGATTSRNCVNGVKFEKPVDLTCVRESFKGEFLKTSFYSDGCWTRAKMENTLIRGTNSTSTGHMKVQVVRYDRDASSPNLLNLTKAKAIIPPDVMELGLEKCLNTCSELTSSLYSDSSSSEEMSVIDDGSKLKLKEQTLRLGDFLYDITLKKRTSRGELKYRIADILKLSFDVLHQVCPDPFLPSEFNYRLLNAFLFLLSDTGMMNVRDITQEEYEDIGDALRACLSRSKIPRFVLEGVVCSGKASVKGITFSEGVERKRSVAWKQRSKVENFRYDVFVDATWKVIAVVHGVCFLSFDPTSNMHHRYQIALEELFTRELIQRWENPTELLDKSAWGNWLLVDVDSTLDNLRACEWAAHWNTPFEMRLDRPFERQRVKRDLSDGDYTQRRSRPVAKLDDYWKKYEAEGGIESKLGGSVKCFAGENEPEGEGQVTVSSFQALC